MNRPLLARARKIWFDLATGPGLQGKEIGYQSCLRQVLIRPGILVRLKAVLVSQALPVYVRMNQTVGRKSVEATPVQSREAGPVAQTHLRVSCLKEQAACAAVSAQTGS